MTDPYGDTDLVALYDVDNPAGVDHDYYRALAETLGARRIIDLGCGTGLLTRPLARPGRSVTGIDPSRTMIDWARRQPRAHQVDWIEGDASSIPVTGDVDLVLCTGNTIMHLSGVDLTATLRQVIRGLCSGGVVSFERRNPQARGWERRTREATVGTRETSLGRLTEWIEVTDVSGGRVTFDAHKRLAHRRGPGLHQNPVLPRRRRVPEHAPRLRIRGHRRRRGLDQRSSNDDFFPARLPSPKALNAAIHRPLDIPSLPRRSTSPASRRAALRDTGTSSCSAAVVR